MLVDTRAISHGIIIQYTSVICEVDEGALLGLGLWKGRDGLSRTEERSGAVMQSQLKASTYPTGRSDAEIAIQK